MLEQQRANVRAQQDLRSGVATASASDPKAYDPNALPPIIPGQPSGTVVAQQLGSPAGQQLGQQTGTPAQALK